MDWDGSRYVGDRCTLFQRESGVLLDVPSLPGSYGIGEIGPHAVKFLHLLKDTGQKLWHVISLHTLHPERLYTGTSYGWNTILISFAWLRDDGLVFPEELVQFKRGLSKIDNHREAICNLRNQFLSNVAENFEKRASQELIAEFLAFQKYNRLWINKFSLFQSLKEELEGKPWYEWPDHLRSFDRLAIEAAQKQLVEKIRKKNILQFLFMRHWKRLSKEAEYLGIRIILTVPVFVLHDSYEVWANQSLFFVNNDGKMTATSGLLPNQMMKGKLFQGPQYRWNRVREEQYKFWVNRLRRELQVVDIVLLENFHALFECYEFPVGEESDGAINGGRLVPTGDQHLIECVFEILQTKNIASSDFNESNLKMERTIRQHAMASAVAMPFCFSMENCSTQVLPKYYGRRHIAYTSHYFSDSLSKWLKSFSDRLSPGLKGEWQRCFGNDLNCVNRNALFTLSKSNAGAVMTTLQDLLELEYSRDEFLLWRFNWEQIDEAIKEKLSKFSQRST